jgi:hypothetical protein|tara:strand:- start:169 stop:432 length:264 start_codon:yes stop_codon:yes gene_type:complete
VKDNLIIGLIAGVIFPLIVVETLIMSVNEDLLTFSQTYLENVCLLAIGLNAGLMWVVLNTFKKDKIGRGILLSNFGYVIAYVIYFYT